MNRQPRHFMLREGAESEIRSKLASDEAIARAFDLPTKELIAILDRKKAPTLAFAVGARLALGVPLDYFLSIPAADEAQQAAA